MQVEDLLAQSGVLNTLANHSRGVDRADANLLRCAYHETATVDYGFFSGSAATFVDMLSESQKTTPPTLHRTSNIAIKVRGCDAISESYVIAYVEDAEFQRLVMGRYLDRLVCENDAWCIKHRLYVLEGNTNRPNTIKRPDPPVQYDYYVSQGSKGASDAGRAILNYHIASSRHLQGVKSMTVEPAALEILLSRANIHDLVSTYCRGVDRADVPMLKSIFWDDSTVISGIVNGSGADFAEGVCAFITTNTDYCFHSVANEWIEIQGDHAVGEHYALAHMNMNGKEIMTGGRYIDSYERRSGVWKIKSRTFVIDWNTTHDSTIQKDGFYSAFNNWGSRGLADPVYAHWSSL